MTIGHKFIIVRIVKKKKKIGHNCQARFSRLATYRGGPFSNLSNKAPKRKIKNK
jgi:hypothetical protein